MNGFLEGAHKELAYCLHEIALFATSFTALKGYVIVAALVVLDRAAPAQLADEIGAGVFR